jgi:hypothetical protein
MFRTVAIEKSPGGPMSQAGARQAAPFSNSFTPSPRTLSLICPNRTDDEGRTGLSIDLHGHRAGILSLATKAKRPLNESDPEVGHKKLVAGTRNQRSRHLPTVTV